MVRSGVADPRLLVLVVEHEVSVVELHLKYREWADVGWLWSSCCNCECRVVGQIRYAFRSSCQGWWLRGADLRAVRELALSCLSSVFHPFIVIRLPLDDLLATGLERIAEILRMHTRPEIARRAVAIQLVVPLNPSFLMESLLALVAAMGIFGLE